MSSILANLNFVTSNGTVNRITPSSSSTTTLITSISIDYFNETLHPISIHAPSLEMKQFYAEQTNHEICVVELYGEDVFIGCNPSENLQDNLNSIVFFPVVEHKHAARTSLNLIACRHLVDTWIREKKNGSFMPCLAFNSKEEIEKQYFLTQSDYEISAIKAFYLAPRIYGLVSNADWKKLLTAEFARIKDTERFHVTLHTLSHAMGLEGKKEKNFFQLTFYNPNLTKGEKIFRFSKLSDILDINHHHLYGYPYENQLMAYAYSSTEKMTDDAPPNQSLSIPFISPLVVHILSGFNLLDKHLPTLEKTPMGLWGDNSNDSIQLKQLLAFKLSEEKRQAIKAELIQIGMKNLPALNSYRKVIPISYEQIRAQAHKVWSREKDVNAIIDNWLILIYTDEDMHDELEYFDIVLSMPFLHRDQKNAYIAKVILYSTVSNNTNLIISATSQFLQKADARLALSKTEKAFILQATLKNTIEAITLYELEVNISGLSTIIQAFRDNGLSDPILSTIVLDTLREIKLDRSKDKKMLIWETLCKLPFLTDDGLTEIKRQSLVMDLLPSAIQHPDLLKRLRQIISIPPEQLHAAAQKIADKIGTVPFLLHTSWFPTIHSVSDIEATRIHFEVIWAMNTRRFLKIVYSQQVLSALLRTKNSTLITAGLNRYLSWTYRSNSDDALEAMLFTFFKNISPSLYPKYVPKIVRFFKANEFEYSAMEEMMLYAFIPPERLFYSGSLRFSEFKQLYFPTPW